MVVGTVSSYEKNQEKGCQEVAQLAILSLNGQSSSVAPALTIFCSFFSFPGIKK